MSGRSGTVYRVVQLVDDTLLYVLLDDGGRLTTRCSRTERLDSGDQLLETQPCSSS